MGELGSVGAAKRKNGAELEQARSQKGENISQLCALKRGLDYSSKRLWE